MTNLESYIRSLYQSLSIRSPEQLTVSRVSEKMGLKVLYSDKSFLFDGVVVIKKSTPQQEWMAFGHEVCHVLRHVGNQLNMHDLFVELQESQADYFAYHFCVPTFMLLNYKEITVYDVMNLFNVDFDFACKRLDMYKNKIITKIESATLS